MHTGLELEGKLGSIAKTLYNYVTSLLRTEIECLWGSRQTSFMVLDFRTSETRCKPVCTHPCVWDTLS